MIAPKSAPRGTTRIAGAIVATAASSAALNLVGASTARAEVTQYHPDLAQAADRLSVASSARGPQVHAALRAVWGTWDRADPGQVEEVLTEAALDARLPPGARAYAGLLTAYARLRRGDVAAARNRVRALGFVDQWLVVGPFDNEGKAGFVTAYGPEAEFRDAIVPGRAYTGKERTVRWRVVPDAFPFGFVDIGGLLRPDRKICAYATTYVSSPRAGRDVSVWVGASGAFKVFWNGSAVLSDTAERHFDADRFATAVHLEPGPNNLTIKVCGEDVAPVLSVRLADPKGEPDRTITATASIDTSARAAETVRATKPRTKAPAGPEGPVQAFERLANAKTPRPEDLEAYARYLVTTGGDDPAVHRARNLAQSAADRAPTVERLLLAADLAEDRNQAARWIERAERLMGPGRRDERVLLARARLAREGPNPREAFPLYEDILRTNPDHVDALRGQIELENDVGLRRTALATLEKAVARNPRCVLLLNMYASELRALGRSTEAAQAEARYAALRFDDRTLLSRFIDLSVARRNKDAAGHWVDRLLSIEPDGQWALGTAARAYRALGETDRAVATYRSALALAPEDVGALRALADLAGGRGDREEQLALLAKVLEVQPQDKDLREYLEHLEPKGSRIDESFAWDSDRFLKMRKTVVRGETRRTLLDLTVTTVFENGLSSRFRQIVFQPMSDSAAALARQYAFQYQADDERVQLRGARVFRTDGTVDQAVESGEGAADRPEIATYTSARTFYVQFPRLEPGDVVELRYRVDNVSTQNQFADYFGEVTYLESSEPISHSEYVLVTPKSRKLHFDAEHVPGLHQQTEERGTDRVYRFYADSVPAVTPEPSMPPWPSVLGYVHASTFESWKDLGRWYWGLVREQFDLDDETRKIARKIAAGRTTPMEKVRAVYDWVVQNTRYVALEFGIYGYKPHRCVQTVSRGWGDCKDKATVIVTLLKELGIDSTIVIVRSGMRGDFDSKIASLSPFDHAIAYVPSLDLYLDGTAEYTGSSELPAMDAGALGLRVNQGDAELVHLPTPDPDKTVRRREVVATLKKDGSAQLELAFETSGTQAAAWRRRFHAESTRKDRVVEELGAEFAEFDVAGPVGVSNLDDLEQPVSMKVRGTAGRFARKEGAGFSVPVTPGFRLTPSYASLSTRRLAVRLPPLGTLEDTFTVKLPPGARIVATPTAVKGETPFGSYAVSVEEQPGKVVVKSRISVRVLTVPPERYDAFRKFCAEADAALTPRLVVEIP